MLLDGEQVCACLVPLGQVRGRSVTTVEGLAGNGGLSRLQRAFHEHGAAQCGICTPGMLMAASTLLGRPRPPSEPEVLDALGGVLCRCTGYRKIVRAVLAAVNGATGDAAGGATGDAAGGATGGATGDTAGGAAGDTADGAADGAIGGATGDATAALADAESEPRRHPGVHDQRSTPRDTGSNGGCIPDPRAGIDRCTGKGFERRTRVHPRFGQGPTRKRRTRHRSPMANGPHHGLHAIFELGTQIRRRPPVTTGRARTPARKTRTSSGT